jgi:DNA processing protein
MNISSITIEDNNYPNRLKTLKKPPVMLYYRGKLSALNKTAAIVGTHAATTEGIDMAFKIGEWLARAGVTVVSGLARGIDTGGHRGCLAGGGTTIAVLGSGLDRIYPPENQDLAEAIARQGAVVSEYEPSARVSKWQLIARNRIIAALADIIIAVEPRFNAQGKMEVLEQARQLHKKAVIVGEKDRNICAEIERISGEALFPFLRDFYK